MSTLVQEYRIEYAGVNRPGMRAFMSVLITPEMLTSMRVPYPEYTVLRQRAQELIDEIWAMDRIELRVARVLKREGATWVERQWPLPPEPGVQSWCDDALGDPPYEPPRRWPL